MIYGPNTNGGSIVSNAEIQSNYIVGSHKKGAMAARFKRRSPAAGAGNFDSAVRRRLKGMAMDYGNNYYKSPSGRNTVMWPDMLMSYGALCALTRGRAFWQFESGRAGLGNDRIGSVWSHGYVQPIVASAPPPRMCRRGTPCVGLSPRPPARHRASRARHPYPAQRRRQLTGHAQRLRTTKAAACGRSALRWGSSKRSPLVETTGQEPLMGRVPVLGEHTAAVRAEFEAILPTSPTEVPA